MHPLRAGPGDESVRGASIYAQRHQYLGNLSGRSIGRRCFPLEEFSQFADSPIVAVCSLALCPTSDTEGDETALRMFCTIRVVVSPTLLW